MAESVSVALDAIEPSLAPGIRLTPTEPWPGLDPYDEASEGYFKGRVVEAAELARLIALAPLTVLYGNSGLGKTSLLLAGTIPLLRKRHFLPVYLRADFSPEAEQSPLNQMAERLDEEFSAHKVDAPVREGGETLWRYLHRRQLEIWSRDNHPLTPVLVFDQFEELFSAGGHEPARVQVLLDALTDLIENRLASDLAADDREGRLRYNRSANRYRIVLTFREDFLPDLESWIDSVPPMLRNRMRLMPMARADAIHAVREAGTAVLADDEMAERIVDFVAQGAADKRRPATVEPVLLSLCCYQLNRRRTSSGFIDAALLERAGEDILESFYRDALQGLPESVPRFIEEHLVQGTRFRGSYALDAALDQGLLTKNELKRLTDGQRLLRVEVQGDTARIELIHDRLVGVVRKARDQRLQAEREADEQRARERAESEDRRQRELRETTAAVSRLVHELQGILSRDREGSTERVLQQLVAMQRLAPTSAPVVALMRAALDVSPRLLKIVGQGAEVLSVAFSPDGTRIVSGGLDGTVQLWDARTGQPFGEPLLPHRYAVTSVAFSPDGTRLVSASEDGELRLLDARTGLRIGAWLAGHSSAVLTTAFSPDGTHIASGGYKTLRLWSADTGGSIGARLAVEGETVWSVAFSPDGKHILSGSEDGGLRLWHAKTLQPIAAPWARHAGAVYSVAFSPDGKRIVSGSQDGTVRLWDGETGQPTSDPLSGHRGGVWSVAFSPDGVRFISGSADQTLLLWSARTGQAIGSPLLGHQGSVCSAAFSPSGASIVSGSMDMTVRLWDSGHECWSSDWPTAQSLRQAVCSRLTRNMSQAQWADWISPGIPYQVLCSELPAPTW